MVCCPALDLAITKKAWKRALGRPFKTELAALDKTYEWAVSTPIAQLTRSIGRVAARDLLVVGSGGSLTSAAFMAYVHERFTGRPARVLTPLELLDLPVGYLAGRAICFLSAGGRNPDIIASAQFAVSAEPAELLAITCREGSPLAALVNSFSHASALEFVTPFGKDGFLAVNSLLGTCSLTLRGYGTLSSHRPSLPTALQDLVSPNQSMGSYWTDLAERARPVLASDSISVMFDFDTRPAAVDLESKFTEAGLGKIHLADYRNFAHGRHYWIAAHAESTAVLAYGTQNSQELRQKTLRLIPAGIPGCVVETPVSGPLGGLGALVTTFGLTSIAGDLSNTDPGRPRVPTFGRKLYNLRIPKQLRRSSRSLKQAVIGRKAGTVLPTGSADYEFWSEALSDYLHSLKRASFGAIVFDYDGTLCHRDQKHQGPSHLIANELRALVASGVKLGIATGRGKSVRADLLKLLQPEWHSNVMVGYYNGGHLRLLDEDLSRTETHDSIPEALELCADALNQEPRIQRHTKIEPRCAQVTVESKRPGMELELWSRIHDIVTSLGLPVKVVRSGHSVDILPEGVSKLAVVDWAKGQALPGTEVLTVGDRGRWPGNDWSLLTTDFSLSVHEVSSNPRSCWNLSPVGSRGPHAVGEMLQALEPVAPGQVRFQRKWLARRSK